MSILAKLVSIVSRRSLRTEAHVFAITPERIAISEGWRAALAMAPLLIIAALLKRPEIALGAVAAFWNCLCDPQGTRTARLKTMVNFTAVGVVVMSLAAWAASFGYLVSLVSLFVLVFLCGLTRSYRPSLGPMPTQAGLIASLAVVIGIASARPLTGALELGGYFLLGSVWTMAFCIFFWPIPFRHAGGLTLATIFGRLDDMAGFLVALNSRSGQDLDDWAQFDTVYRRGVRMSLERGRALAALDSSHGTRFGATIDAAGRVFSALVAIGHFRHNSRQALDEESMRLLNGLRQLLQGFGAHALLDQTVPEALRSQADVLLRESTGRGTITARAVVFATKAMRRLATHDDTVAMTQTLPPTVSAHTRYRIDALVWRHALRVAVAAVLALAIGTWFNLPLAYWGALATIIVTQPISANTWLRVLERACGSLLGGFIAAFILTAAPGPLAMTLAILPLAAAAIAFRLVNYGLFVVFLCPMFMLISDFIHPAQGLIAARFVNELVGAVLGVAASFLFWPERHNDALHAAISTAIAANMKFASAVLRQGGAASANLDQLQREAGIASTRLETTRERMLLEGRWRSAQLKRLWDLIVVLRSICGAAAVIEVAQQDAPGADDQHRADRYDAISSSLLEALKLKKIPSPLPPSASSADDLEQEIRKLSGAIKVYVSS